MCGTAGSGIWVLKGHPRGRMLPANLDHLSVEWRTQRTCDAAWVAPGHDCLCSCAYGHGAAVRPQTDGPIWDDVICLWSRIALLLSPWCAGGVVPTGVNLNRYASSGSRVPWHSDHEPLFGPQNSFKVRRRVPGEVPSSTGAGSW